jgi:peptidoglycan/LPS O-acetylase OafA/YrhL
LMKIAMGSGLYDAAGAKVTYAVVLAGTIGAGCAAYALVERPLLGMLRSRSEKRAQAAREISTPAAG